MYSRIVLNTFLILKCIRLDDSTNLYLEKLPDIVCWHSNEHIKLLLGVLLPCLSIWCVAWPIYLLRLLYTKNKAITLMTHIQRSNSTRTIKKITIQETQFQPQTRRSTFKNDDLLDTQKIYKYLTVDYTIGAYYWEFYFYITNFFVSSLAYTTSQLDPVSQAALLIASFELMLLFSKMKSPFKYAAANDLQVLI